MFRKLRNHFVLTSMAITTSVLLIAFSAIYLVAASSANHRPPQKISIEYDDNVTTLFEDRLHEDRQVSLNSLLASLVITGVALEFAVFLISLYLAEQAIKPVRDAYDSQKAFIANASHEIKTPLAVISANLEAADIQGNHWIDNVTEKVEDLTTLNNQLLTLAQNEGSPVSEKDLSEFDLGRLVKSVTNPFAPQISNKHLTLTISPTPKKKVRLNRPALKQILNILVDNAIKYSAHSIQITLDEHSIKVTNDGATISKDQLPHLFDRFYQVDKTKSGLGLGLAIAHQIAEANGWTLSASSDQKTTSFTLTF